MQNISEEQWRPVIGFETNYAVSDAGNVKRLTPGPGTRPGRVIKPGWRRDYQFFALSVASKTYYKAAHRLVYEAFVGPIPEGMHINHKNGVKHDNRLSNLEVLTPSENTAHGFRVLGRKPPNNPSPGERNGRAKLTWPLVHSLRQRYEMGGITHDALAKEYGISKASVSYIVNRLTWRDQSF